MKIRIFQSDKGDCLLLTSASGAHVLVDGGMSDAFTTHVQPFLGKMAAAGKHLDLVYVSHIDQDHIAGVLKLLDNTMTWRVHDYRQAKGLSTKLPAVPRMPPVHAIWHNAFSMLLKENAHAAEDLLAQSSQVMALSTDDAWQGVASSQQELAYSMSEAVRVSRRVAADQLAIPLNAEFGGQLILVRQPAGVDATVGGMDIRVVGPFAEDVERLRDEWDDWLRTSKATVASLRAKAKEDAARIGHSADGLGSALEIYLKQLGNRNAVTAPNLASVMLLVEEAGQRVLLTGDGHADDILAGLEHHGVLLPNQELRVDVLKGQHHWAEHNVTPEFCQRVFADKYIFCGNGEHGNPDLDAMKLLLDTNEAVRPGLPYELWFNCDATVAPEGKPREHMKKLMKLVTDHAATHAHVKCEFLNASSVELRV